MQQNSLVRNLSLFFFVSLGLFIGIVLVFAAGSAGKQFNSGVLVLLISAAAFSAAAGYIFKKKNTLMSSEGLKERSEVGFVVDTFHDVVGKLREKEKELERLRAFAEDRAVRIEAYNENILQSVPSGVVSIDNELKIRSMNQAAEHILGVRVRDVMDRPFTMVFNEPLTAIMKENRAVSRAEYSYETGDGRHIWLGITTSELKSSAGEKLGFISVFTDLTDIKALQAQVELKERLSQLGEMSAGIAHELRNSMSVIAGYARLLGKKVAPSNIVTVDAISNEIKVMDRTISELLAFARPSVPDLKQVDLYNLIADTASAVLGDNERVPVSVKAESPVSIIADAGLLRQALSNLIINAAESMPDGGPVDIELKRAEDRVKILIRDTGCGIPRDIMRKIFLPFYTTKPQGTGFGLALVQKTVISHGGSIEVESEEGKGATFILNLPDADTAARNE
ncbi:MAG: PAS domain S-box protein [Nitrospirae bacterium]|nr:PAS domain S-box protein [Nitrospirota bacterium]